MTGFLVVVFIVARLAGALASMAGFGIGSLLTPLLAVRVGVKAAVAAVSIPHFIATALRLWMLRRHVERRVLFGFGLMSAADGLVGAVLHAYVDSPVLRIVFGALLVFVGIMWMTGLAERMRFDRTAAWIAGAVSGLLGGLVGNQGGIRSAALLGFDIPKQAFVATATAVGVIVDVARVPVYLATGGAEMASHWPAILAATVGVVVGTLAGERVLRRLPESIFRQAVSALILVLGSVMLFGMGE
jgi:uncharacterized protein